MVRESITEDAGLDEQRAPRAGERLRPPALCSLPWPPHLSGLVVLSSGQEQNLVSKFLPMRSLRIKFEYEEFHACPGTCFLL